MINIIYIGNSVYMLKQLMSCPHFSIKAILCEKKTFEKFKALIHEKSIFIFQIDNKQQLEEHILNLQIPTAIMYNFGIIIPQSIINNVKIFNFHAGSLEYNRGSSPVNWSILLNERETEMSLYKISSEIDLGLLISASKVTIDENDIPSTLLAKLEKTIPHLLNILNEYLNGKIKGCVISKGKYRKRITEADYTIDLKKDSLATINAKIRSQADYSGAILYIGNEKKYISQIEDLKNFRINIPQT